MRGNEAEIALARVSGTGSDHGARMRTTREMAWIDSRNVVCHQEKGRSAVPCCELHTRSNLGGQGMV